MVVVLFRVRGLTQSSSPAAEPVSLGPTLGLTLVVARHPDNTIDNLVAAHAARNNAKSASLAGLEHLRRWTGRFRPGQLSNAVQYMADVTGWPRRSDRVLSTARAYYLWLPRGTRLNGQVLVGGLILLEHRGGDAAAVVDLNSMVFGPGADTDGLVTAGRRTLAPATATAGCRA